MSGKTKGFYEQLAKKVNRLHKRELIPLAREIEKELAFIVRARSLESEIANHLTNISQTLGDLLADHVGVADGRYVHAQLDEIGADLRGLDVLIKRLAKLEQHSLKGADVFRTHYLAIEGVVHELQKAVGTQ